MKVIVQILQMFWIFMRIDRKTNSSMVNPKVTRRPTIFFRPAQPSDLHSLQKIHGDIFPIRYESEFFQNVVSGRDIVSWIAVDCSRPDGQNDEPIGFITARIILAKESEIADLLRYDSSKSEQMLIYILTLGVVETYRNLGIASSLIHQVIKYASSIQTCTALYLHVISYNSPAICFYNKMSFKCIQKLQDFYLINGQHYDAYLFVYFVNGRRSPCSPIELVAIFVNYLRSGFKLVVATLWKNGEKNLPKRPKCKEVCFLMSTTPAQNKRYTIEDSGFECV